jgi:O-antigen/teichoic acid export membrane protein
MGILVLLLFGDLIVYLLLAQAYRDEALPLLIWIAAGYSMLGIASSFELKAYAIKRTSVISTAYGIAAIVNLGFNLLWIPTDGLLGAARATFFGYLAYLVAIVIASYGLLRSESESDREISRAKYE